MRRRDGQLLRSQLVERSFRWRAYGHEAHERSSRSCDDHIVAVDGRIQQTRQLGLRLSDVHLSGHALTVAELPHHHRDPFDRLLIAQAQLLQVPIVTADDVLDSYDVDVLLVGG